MVLFDQGTYDKLLSEVPKYKLVTPSILSDRLRVCIFFLLSIHSPICLFVLGQNIYQHKFCSVMVSRAGATLPNLCGFRWVDN